MTEERTITVGGMTCDGCERSIQRAVGALDGVEEVTADHVAGRITVRFDAASVQEGAIHRRVEEAGYTVET